MSLFMASIELVESIKDNIVTESNVPIEANYKLSSVLWSKKIILVLASNIQPSDDDFKTYTFPIGIGPFC
ncbi:replication initiation protein [Bacillus sp. Sa1BUA2]|uniref:Replication initiation protein n=1 Tax=Bacillus norwichensis TaxID=2762217 RepID=A0ABR8VN84_9BACI|nr:RepB family plasmid replication initiator protein [Bacillus norwichensis]MBD8006229.1 replication initiation protein [Bacillus norwichensis]